VASAGGLIRITTSTSHGRSTGDVVTVLGVGGIPELATPTSWRITVVDATKFTLDGSNF